MTEVSTPVTPSTQRSAKMSTPVTSSAQDDGGEYTSPTLNSEEC